MTTARTSWIRSWRRWQALHVHADFGVEPITRLAADDIIVAGYPKSGNTWFQYLAAGLLYGVDVRRAPDRLIQDLVPDLHAHAYYRRYRTPMYFKSHHLPRPEYRRVIYLLRDGRDAMVSYWHHLTALQGRPLDFLTLVRDGKELFPCKWHQHVQAWRSNPYHATMLLIKYEDLIRQPLEELRRFCAFIDLGVDDQELERVIQQSSFEQMRLKERREGWDHPTWPKDKAFVRSGKVGSYQTEMPQTVLDAFLSEAEPTLRTCGYLA